MRKLLLACVLISSIVAQAMDDSLEYQQKLATKTTRDVTEEKSDKTANWEGLKLEYVPYMLTLLDMFDVWDGTLTSLKEVPFKENFRPDVFKTLMNLLGDCIAYAPIKPTDEQVQAMQGQISARIKSGHYPLAEMVAMPNMIAFFDIRFLHNSMLDTLLSQLLDTMKTTPKFVQSCLNKLDLDQQKILKQKLVKQHTSDVWLAVGSEVEMVSLPDHQLITSSDKYIDSFIVFLNREETKYSIRDNNGTLKCEIKHPLPAGKFSTLDDFDEKIAYNNEIFGILINTDTIMLYSIASGELIKKITPADLQTLTHTNDITNFYSMKFDNGFLSIVTNSNVVLFASDYFDQICAAFNRKQCGEKSQIKAFITPDKTKLIISEEKFVAPGVYYGTYLTVFDIATKQRLVEKDFSNKGGTLTEVTNLNITMCFDVEINTTYDVNTFNIIHSKRKPQLSSMHVPWFDNTNQAKYLDVAKALVCHNSLTKQSKVIRKLLKTDGKLEIDNLDLHPHTYAFTGIIVLLSYPRNGICNCFLFSLWSYIENHSLLDMLQRMNDTMHAEEGDLLAKAIQIEAPTEAIPAKITPQPALSVPNSNSQSACSIS